MILQREDIQAATSNWEPLWLNWRPPGYLGDSAALISGDMSSCSQGASGPWLVPPLQFLSAEPSRATACQQSPEPQMHDLGAVCLEETADVLGAHARWARPGILADGGLVHTTMLKGERKAY